MMEALNISKKALPACLPNPPVGCVIVHDGKILAKGYTRPPGHNHAEADALTVYEGDLSLCDVYVTLEPCSFYGRTPSCASALAVRKPKKVFVSLLDPDPRNQGAGIAILQNAGIDVDVGLSADKVRDFIGTFLKA